MVSMLRACSLLLLLHLGCLPSPKTMRAMRDYSAPGEPQLRRQSNVGVNDADPPVDDLYLECGGSFASKYTGVKEVVDSEDCLRLRAGNYLGCEPAALSVVAVEIPDVPTGWAADAAGCGKTSRFVFGRGGWALDASAAFR